MNDLRSPLEDRPYRPSARPMQDDDVMSTSEYYRTKFETIRQSRWFPLASVLAAVLIFSGVVSYAYKQGSQTGSNATTPIVEASNESYKEKPANPGGMDVPFQDAIVFDNLQNKDQTASAEKVESLLPPPEQPVAATTDAAAPATTTTTTAATTPETPAAAPATDAVAQELAKTETKTEATTTETAAATPAATTTATTPATTTAAAAPVVTETAPVAAATTTVAETPKAVPAKTETVKTAAIAPKAVAKKMDSVAPASAPATTKIQSGTYRIQLGAFRDEPTARAAWTKIQKQFSSQLTSVKPAFPRADLGAKGIFYRVQGVNLSKVTADELCRSITAAKGTCIVTK